MFGEIMQIPEQVYIDSGKPGITINHYDLAISNGEELFSVRDIRTGKYHTGIALNKTTIGGKVVYVSFPEYGNLPTVMQYCSSIWFKHILLFYFLLKLGIVCLK